MRHMNCFQIQSRKWEIWSLLSAVSILRVTVSFLFVNLQMNLL